MGDEGWTVYSDYIEFWGWLPMGAAGDLTFPQLLSFLAQVRRLYLPMLQ
jgi:hypothetical protein